MTAMTADGSAWDAVDSPVGANQRTFNPRVVGSSPTGLQPAKWSSDGMKERGPPLLVGPRRMLGVLTFHDEGGP
jgi:hypothetical protein